MLDLKKVPDIEVPKKEVKEEVNSDDSTVKA
jgi:hypothetical protein